MKTDHIRDSSRQIIWAAVAALIYCFFLGVGGFGECGEPTRG